MKKLISFTLALALIFQLNSFMCTTVSADNTVNCKTTASPGNASENVNVSTSASSFNVTYNSSNIYTTKNVTFTATSKVGSGLVFDHWKDGYGNNISQDSSYTQALASSVDYKAYFNSYTPATVSMLSTSNTDYSTAYNLTASVPVKYSPGNAITVSSDIAVPRKCNVVEAGAIFYEGVYKDGFNIFSDNVTKVQVASITKKTSSEWLGLVKKTTGSYSVSYTPIGEYGVLSRAYCIYTDGSNQIYIRYTEPQYTRPDTAIYNNVKSYDVVFNWEMLATFTGVGSNEVHTKELHQEAIEKVAKSDSDLITVTPQMYRMNLYPTDVPGEGFAEKEKYLNSHPEYEIDYYLLSSNPSVGNTWYDRARDYIYIQGNDPTLEVIEAVKANGADCFINYRMNDHHNTCTDKENADNDRTAYPTHSAFWLENEDEYGIGFTSNRVLNYMAPHIRDHYYQILEELATKYVDHIDGIELDFDRYFEFFSFEEVSQGRAILTDFVARVREMLNRVGMEHGKYLQLSVRVPGQTTKGNHYGIDALTWDAKGYVDIIALSNHYYNTMDIDIESFTQNNNSNERAHAKINGEIHYVSYQEGSSNVADNGAISSSTYRRYLTKEGYYATATNYLARGVDGVHLFNVLYSAQKEQIYKDLAVLKDKEALAKADKCYIIPRGGRSGVYDGAGSLNSYVGFQQTKTNRTYKVYIPDDMSNFTDAVLKLEYYTNIVDESGTLIKPEITVSWGSDTVASTMVQQVNIGSTELFPALADNRSYTTWDESMFFRIPMELMESSNGIYNFTVTVVNGETLNTESNQLSVESAEIALYNNADKDNNELAELNPGFSGGVNNMTIVDSRATVGAVSSFDSYDGDGYVLSATNRTNEIVGGKFENVNFIPGNLYLVSAFAKLINDGEAKAVMNVDRQGNIKSGEQITLSDDSWTRVFFYYDLTTETGESFDGNIYVTTPGGTDDILLDCFEVFKVEPYSPVAGNIYEQYDPSFESGNPDKWLKFKATVGTIQADPFPRSGKWSGYATGRNTDANPSAAAGLQLQYVDVMPDTYYYVTGYGRTDSFTSVNAKIMMQYQVKDGSKTYSNTGGAVIKNQNVPLNNLTWQRVDGIFKTMSKEELSEKYPSGQIQGKVYLSADYNYNLYYDDFAAVPICINENFKVVTPVDGEVILELTVPLEFDVSKSTLKTTLGTVKDIVRNGTKCVVTLSEIDKASEGKLTLVTSNTVKGAPDAELEFKVTEPNMLSIYNPGFANGVNNMTSLDNSATIKVVETVSAIDGDGYVLSVTNRSNEIAAGKFEDVTFTPGKLYVVSALAKLGASGNAKAKINVETGTGVQSGNEIALSADDWTRVFFYYDLTEFEGEEFKGDIYLTTPGSKANLLLDYYHLLEVVPYSQVEGNIYNDSDSSFESGSTSSWLNSRATVSAIQIDPLPHSGKWCGYSKDRNATTSYANGLQTAYVSVNPETYYYVSGWVRTDSDVSFAANLSMQFQLSKKGATSVNGGGTPIKSTQVTVDNSKWYKIDGIYKSFDKEIFEQDYSGYSLKAKLYPNVDPAANLYLDDFAAVPICINEEYKCVTPVDGVAVLNLTIPVEFEISEATLTTSVGDIQSIEREGINCTVTLGGLNSGIDGALSLATSDVVPGSEPAVMNFKVNGYSLDVVKSENGENVSCLFKNYTEKSAPVRFAIVAYENNRVVDFTYIDAITVGAFKTSEPIVLPLYTSGDRVEILALHPGSIAPYVIPFNCNVLW